MSVDKFLKRIVAPDMDKGGHKALHEYTHGLTSEPLVLLSIVWSALIHDVDHRGVSNMQLAKEEQQMAQAYHNKSIAEQNSVDISWDLLMKPEFNELRRAMFTDRDDVLRFREVIVRIVLATDIFDKELNDLRKQRWNKAFGSSSSSGANNNDDLRATIVMEHIIQASDVAHTMQVCLSSQYFLWQLSFRSIDSQLLFLFSRRVVRLALARISQVESALVLGDARRVQGRPNGKEPSGFLVSRGNWLFRQLHVSDPLAH